jgi:hypothetical protein
MIRRDWTCNSIKDFESVCAVDPNILSSCPDIVRFVAGSGLYTFDYDIHEIPHLDLRLWPGIRVMQLGYYLVNKVTLPDHKIYTLELIHKWEQEFEQLRLVKKLIVPWRIFGRKRTIPRGKIILPLDQVPRLRTYVGELDLQYVNL